MGRGKWGAIVVPFLDRREPRVFRNLRPQARRTQALGITHRFKVKAPSSIWNASASQAIDQRIHCGQIESTDRAQCVTEVSPVRCSL